LLKLGAEIAKYEAKGNKLSIFVQDVSKKIIIRETTRLIPGSDVGHRERAHAVLVHFVALPQFFE
jgi:hypothetical protein